MISLQAVWLWACGVACFGPAPAEPSIWKTPAVRELLIAQHGADHAPPQLHPPGHILLSSQGDRACVLLLSVHTGSVEPGDSLILRTADQGQHWTVDRLTGSYAAHDIRDGRGWLLTHLDAGGQLPLLYRTDDDGQHWAENASLTEPLSRRGICCFLEGSRLRFTSEQVGEVWVEDLNPAPSAPTHYRLLTENGGSAWRVAEEGSPPPAVVPSPEAVAPGWCSVASATRALSSP